MTKRPHFISLPIQSILSRENTLGPEFCAVQERIASKEVQVCYQRSGDQLADYQLQA